MLEEYGSTDGNYTTHWQFKMRLTLENLLIIIGGMYTADQMVVFETIQEVKWIIKNSCMIK